MKEAIETGTEIDGNLANERGWVVTMKVNIQFRIQAKVSVFRKSDGVMIDRTMHAYTIWRQ